MTCSNRTNVSQS